MNTNRAPIRIGTRDSTLALWQAKQVQEGLSRNGVASTLVSIKSDGDLNLVTPLYEMGVEGIFTKALDAHLLSGNIDIAVHSMKDVPIGLARGIVKAAVLLRGSYKDVLLARTKEIWHKLNDGNPAEGVIATSSMRRKAQWLNRYPEHRIENLRGNIQTRLEKLDRGNWDGAIFAAAGLERLDIRYPFAIELDWMVPAPAQGAIMVVCRSAEEWVYEQCAALNDPDTDTCVRVERDFLKGLLGGCATPIGAYAYMAGQKLYFKGNILSADGNSRVDYEHTFDSTEAPVAGAIAAAAIREKGGLDILKEFKRK